jgi:hypothetical protein
MYANESSEFFDTFLGDTHGAKFVLKSCLIKVSSPCNRNLATSRDIDQPCLNIVCTTAMNNHFLSESSFVEYYQLTAST